MARQYYQPRAFPRVTMPTPAPMPDPLRTLSGLANLAHGVESIRAFKDDRAREQQVRSDEDTLAQAYEASGGDWSETMRRLRSEGKHVLADRAEGKLTQQRTETLENLGTNLAQAYEASGGDWSETMRRLRSEGKHVLADRAEGKLTQQRTETLENLGTKYRARSDGLKLAAQLVQGIQAVPEPDQPQAFLQARDRILDAVGPELGSHVPPQWDSQWGQQALERGLETADILKVRGAAAVRARQGLKDQNDLYDTYGPALGTAQSPEDFAEMVDGIFTLHPELATEGLRQQIGDFSEENLAQLRGATPPDAAGASSDYGRALARHANSLGTSPDALTTEDELDFRRQFTAAGRPPPVESKSPTGPSLAQIGAAERALYSALADLQDRQKNIYDYSEPLTDEEYQERRLRAFNAYRRSQGWPAWDRVPTPKTPGMVLMRSPPDEDGRVEEDWVPAANVTAAQAQGAVLVMP